MTAATVRSTLRPPADPAATMDSYLKTTRFPSSNSTKSVSETFLTIENRAAPSQCSPLSQLKNSDIRMSLLTLISSRCKRILLIRP